mgnify:CR=1 FL=1
MKSKILITGAAGFIGYHLIKKLLSENIYSICGLDNLNSYYDINLKKNRLSNLEKRNFIFFESNISSYSCLKEIFDSFKPDIVINLAAQAGVRYSLIKPSEFVDNNIKGFYNLIDLAKNYKAKKIIYASSSSIYGDSKNFPLSESQKVKPKNIYALSKKVNEEMADVFSKQYDISFIGLRFFTVYGEWGRPDMMILKLLNAAYKKQKFYLNNSGNHWRDFTYIDDVVNILEILIKKKYRSNQIFNICCGKPIFVRKLVNTISKKILFNKIINTKLNKFEVHKTHGKNNKVIKFTRFKKFTNVYEKLDSIIAWHKKFRYLI